MQSAPILQIRSTHLQLRESTRSLHEAVEAVVGLPGRADTLEAYRAMLKRFWGFHQPLEADLADRDWGGFDFEPRRRAEEAASDLRALGVTREDLMRIPRRAAMAIEGQAEAWGVLYVLEGSTLGGRVIRRSLAESLGGGMEGATRFFDGRGSAAGPLWRSFLAALEEAVASPGARARAQAGAEATFRGMIDWFSAPEAQP